MNTKIIYIIIIIMIFSSIAEIAEKILNPDNAVQLERGVKLKEKHELHVAGIGLKKFLQKIDGVENEKALELRRKLANEATVRIFATTLKPLDKIFSAQGGSRIYDIENDNDKELFKQKIKSSTGYSLQKFMDTVWRKKLNLDPFGILLLELNKLGETEINYYPVNSIKSIAYKNIITIEYIIFEYNDIKENDAEFYRVIDDQRDIIVKRKKGGNKPEDFEIVEYNEGEPVSFVNYFGKVPGCIISDNDDVKVDGCKTSYIWEAMTLADEYLFDHSLFRIYKTKVGIVRTYEFQHACDDCQGQGRIQTDNAESGYIICPSCQGTGIAKERNLSDITIIPEVSDPNVKIPIPPFGYGTPPVEVHRILEEDLMVGEDKIYSAIWGSISGVDKEKSKNTTAFEVSVRKEPEKDKLKEISRNGQMIEQFFTDLLGDFYLGVKYHGSVITYGTKYNLKTSIELLDEYIKLKEKKASIYVLNKAWMDYLMSEFQDNPRELAKQQKLFLVDPYAHYDLIEMAGLNPLPGEFQIKKNLDKYVYRFETEVKPIYIAEVEEIQNKFNEYANNELKPINDASIS